MQYQSIVITLKILRIISLEVRINSSKNYYVYCYIKQHLKHIFYKYISKIDFWCLMPLSEIFQLYHGDQFKWWKKPEYLKRTTDHGQATGKLYHLRLRVECTLFCKLQNRVQSHTILVIGLYELLGNPTT